MKKQSTSKGFAILSAAGIAVKIISLLYLPFLINIIKDDGLAVYGVSYQIFVFMYVITNSGIPVAISKLVSELIAVKNYKDAVKSFKIARMLLLALGTIMAILMAVLATPIASFVGNPKSALAIRALAPTILLTSVVSAYRGYFQGRGNMTPTAVSQVIEQIFNTIFSLVFAGVLIKYGIEYGAAGGTIGTTIGAFIAGIFLIWFYEKSKKMKISQISNDSSVVRHSNSYLIKKILSYGIPITICIALQNAGTIVDLAIIFKRLAVAGFDTSGRAFKYAALIKYNTLINVPIAIISALSAAILPAISGAAILKNKSEVQNKINYAFRLCFLISIPCAFGMAVLSQPVFKLLFPKFLEGFKLMQYGSLVIVLMSIVLIQTTILQSIGKLYLSTFYLILGISGKIITNYILVAIPSININGAIYGSMICFILPLLLSNRLIKRSLKIKYNLFNQALKPFIASVFMGLVVYISYFDIYWLLKFTNRVYINNAMATFISIAIGAYVYLYGLILTGGITQSDLTSMPSRLVKLIPKIMLKRVR